MDYCAACGKPLVPGGSFCPYCGTKAGQPADVDALLEDLVSHDGAARKKALKAIEKLGPAADAAVAKLAAALQKPRAEGLPAEALVQLGRHADEALAYILQGMTRDESLDVRHTHLGSLMKCGERAAAAAPRLREILREALRGNAAYPDVAESATIALGWIGPAAAEAKLEVLEALRHREAQVRKAAAFALGRWGGKDVAFQLKEASRDPDADVAKEAKKALKQIG